jgi:hypothetical protein
MSPQNSPPTEVRRVLGLTFFKRSFFLNLYSGMKTISVINSERIRCEGTEKYRILNRKHHGRPGYGNGEKVKTVPY